MHEYTCFCVALRMEPRALGMPGSILNDGASCIAHKSHFCLLFRSTITQKQLTQHPCMPSLIWCQSLLYRSKAVLISSHIICVCLVLERQNWVGSGTDCTAGREWKPSHSRSLQKRLTSVQEEKFRVRQAGVRHGDVGLCSSFFSVTGSLSFTWNQPPQHRDYRHLPLCLAFCFVLNVGLGTKLTPSCLRGKPFINCAVSPALIKLFSSPSHNRERFQWTV